MIMSWRAIEELSDPEVVDLVGIFCSASRDRCTLDRALEKVGSALVYLAGCCVDGWFRCKVLAMRTA
jgi:hypothetical protein